MQRLRPPETAMVAHAAATKMKAGTKAAELSPDEVHALLCARFPGRKNRRKAKIRTTNTRDVLRSMTMMAVVETKPQQGVKSHPGDLAAMQQRIRNQKRKEARHEALSRHDPADVPPVQ